MNDSHWDFSPARTASLLLRTAALAFVFALPGSLGLAQELLNFF